MLGKWWNGHKYAYSRWLLYTQYSVVRCLYFVDPYILNLFSRWILVSLSTTFELTGAPYLKGWFENNALKTPNECNFQEKILWAASGRSFSVCKGKAQYQLLRGVWERHTCHNGVNGCEKEHHYKCNSCLCSFIFPFVLELFPHNITFEMSWLFWNFCECHVYCSFLLFISLLFVIYLTCFGNVNIYFPCK